MSYSYRLRINWPIVLDSMLKLYSGQNSLKLRLKDSFQLSKVSKVQVHKQKIFRNIIQVSRLENLIKIFVFENCY